MNLEEKLNILDHYTELPHLSQDFVEVAQDHAELFKLDTDLLRGTVTGYDKDNDEYSIFEFHDRRLCWNDHDYRRIIFDDGDKTYFASIDQISEDYYSIEHDTQKAEHYTFWEFRDHYLRFIDKQWDKVRAYKDEHHPEPTYEADKAIDEFIRYCEGELDESYWEQAEA